MLTDVCLNGFKSYSIDVDPLQFARDNYDDYWGMFGIWPKAVQNAAEYNLEWGSCHCYRTWNQAYDVLANGGRIVMSVGRPLYTGHLMMLAGFDSQGNPLVHDPARKKVMAINLIKLIFQNHGLIKVE